MIQLIAILHFYLQMDVSGYLALRVNGDDYTVFEAHCLLVDLISQKLN